MSQALFALRANQNIHQIHPCHVYSYTSTTWSLLNGPLLINSVADVLLNLSDTNQWMVKQTIQNRDESPWTTTNPLQIPDKKSVVKVQVSVVGASDAVNDATAPNFSLQLTDGAGTFGAIAGGEKRKLMHIDNAQVLFDAIVDMNQEAVNFPNNCFLGVLVEDGANNISLQDGLTIRVVIQHIG